MVTMSMESLVSVEFLECNSHPSWMLQRSKCCRADKGTGRDSDILHV